MHIIDIDFFHLASGYLLLLLPLGILLWLKVPLLNQTLVAILRMSVQLVFVGFYLQFIFDLNNHWLTSAWIIVMVLVADFSIVRGCQLRLRKVAAPLFLALAVGTAIPLLYFVVFLLRGDNALSAQYLIPLSGLILGNCLRADIIGLRTFYSDLKKHEKRFESTLAQGANLQEALRPFIRDACEAALTPTIAATATIGLVALPGVMTGVILGGGDPMVAIKYQIAIMIAILTGTAITVVLAMHLTVRKNFSAGGVLHKDTFTAANVGRP